MATVYRDTTRPHIAAALIVMMLVATARLAFTEPRGSATPRTQVGLASFYGPGFHGEQTASGQIFDQRTMVAAHPTLPFGSVVRVTNLKNGRRVVVRIVDRGPYGKNRRAGTIIDVSKGAAQRLRFIRDGLVRVRLDVLRQETSSTVYNDGR